MDGVLGSLSRWGSGSGPGPIVIRESGGMLLGSRLRGWIGMEGVKRERYCRYVI